MSDAITKKTDIFRTENDVELLNGEVLLGGYQLAYETYGELNKEASNAILVFHALTGSQNLAGHTSDIKEANGRWTEDCQEGWWDGFVGPGKALDVNRYYIVCANYLGGCYGSTGPSSINPDTGKPYGSSFPRLSIRDIVDTQLPLLDHLGIEKLHAVIGGSVGGMLSISLATRYPEKVSHVVPIASGLAPSKLQRLHNFEQVLAIESDSNFKGGDYYEGDMPNSGLALARMIQHKTFISLRAMETRAKGEVQQPDDHKGWYMLRHALESYMMHQGKKFVKRFDANSYLRIIDAWQNYDACVEAGVEKPEDLFARCKDHKFLQFSIDSDVCFYPEDQGKIATALSAAGVPNMHLTVHSEKGHDSFLIEPDLYTPHISFALQGGEA